MAVTYTAPQYDEKKYREGINTDYYTQATENYKQQAEQNRATQLGDFRSIVFYFSTHKIYQFLCS